MTRFATIKSTGRYIPEIEVSNDTLREKFAHIPDFVDKMEESSSIRTRWWAPEDWCASDIALPAARQALERAGRHPSEVDLVILGTDSPDYVTPATSVVLQHKLGAHNAGTFDVGCACASFPTGAAIAAGMIASNPALRTVLVIGVYNMHKLASPDDPMVFFYGDGAGAAVLEPVDEPGFISSAMRADGAYHRHWGLYAGATFEPATEDAVREGRTTVKMLERYPPEINHDGWPAVVRALAANGGFEVSDIDFTIFTQVRRPSIELVMADLGLPMSTTHTVMEKWGYTGSACVPIALDDAIEQGKIASGDLVALVGSGVGYNQAGVAFRMP
ncbi:MAG: ketoacyl-ACP synthase III [Holophagae bacterium]|jgi:3-oxoacyl-[acyl-carrier-protein] synthase-3